jgi:hypothetical protein
MEFDERTKPILVKLRTAIGVERLDRWILANGLVDDAPPERELAALGLSRAAATAELARLRMRLDAGRALERGVGAVAFTDGGEGGQKVESVGADTLTALLIGRELADPGERESMRALLLELLGRLNTRVAEEVRPLERSLTELGEWGARPRDRESALEASRRFSATLERVVPLRDSIEAEFVAEVRAAMGDDAGSVAEAMLAANAARDACLRLSRSYHSATRVEAFGGAPLDLDQLAIVLDDPASRAWLRERLRQHGPALRAQATEFRRHATRLAASVVAVHVTIPVIRFRGGPLAEQLAALRQAFPSVDDYLKVVVEVEPAEAASDGQAGTKPGGDGALTDEHGAVIRRLSTGPAPTIGLSVAVLSSLRAWGDAETRAFGSRDREPKADPGSDEEARIESLIAIEIALQRGGPRAAGLREMRRMLACVESTDAGEDSDDLRLLRKLLRASQSRFERALAEARVVVEEPLGAQVTTSDEALDAEYSRRSIAVQGAQHAWRCETDFAHAAFEWLAPPAARDRFRNRTE